MALSTLSPEALSAFCLQLHELLQAGISPDEGLDILREDTSDPTEQALLERLSSRLQEGVPMSVALEEESCFPPYMVNMLAVGERTGNQDTVLHALSGYYDREQTLSESIKSAVIYPAVMAVMMTALLLVLTIFVLPAFSDVFVSLGLTLSPLSGFLMTAGRVLAPLCAVLIVAALVAGAVIYSKWSKGQPTVLTKLKLSRQIDAGRFVSALALMMRSGLDLGESIERAAQMFSVEEMKKAGEAAAMKVADEGVSLTDAMAEMNVLTAFHLRMMRVGERAGRSDTMLEEVAGRLAADVAARTDRLIARIEPTIVVVLAVVAGMVLLSVMMPLLGVLSVSG